MRQKFDLSQLPPSPDLRFERELWVQGAVRVAGLDEAGRGSLAGPVAAAAVILPAGPGLEQRLAGVRDSKQMTPDQRACWAERIRQNALDWGLGFSSALEIDECGILPATCLAMQRALACLSLPAQHLLIDFVVLPGTACPQTALVKGDARSLSIAAASVLAKTGRDAWMVAQDELYPGYGFVAHKGYGTRAHYAALARLGPCAIHRHSFNLGEQGVSEQ